MTRPTAMKFKSLEQLQYWQGQALRSRDFNDEPDYAEQLRWWHNRASHGAFGVGFGLEMDQDGTLHCGLAYDCFGRELVVAQNRVLKPVASGATQYLALTWAAAGAQPAWIPPDRASVTAGVLLARADSGGVIDTAFHPLQSRALARPRILGGSTPPGNTPWEKIMRPDTLASRVRTRIQRGRINDDAIGLQVRIDTSAAGFMRKPLYFVSLMWEADQIQRTAADEDKPRFSPPWLAITDATKDGFTARLLLQAVQEAVDVSSDIKTVSQAEWSSASHKVGTLLPEDVVARLLPRIDTPGAAATASRIDGPGAGSQVWNLAVAPGTVGLKAPGPVVLVNLPRSPGVTRSAHAVTVASALPFVDGSVVLRRGGTVAGSAAVIEKVLSNNHLLLATAMTGLQNNDNIDILDDARIVDSVDGDNVTVNFAAKTKFKAGDIIVRMSGAVESEIPAEVLSVPSSKSIKLKAPFPSLLKDDVLGAARPATAVTGQVNVLIAVAVEQFRVGDVLRAADGATAIVAGIDGTALLLDSALTVAGGGSVSIGDFGVKSTVTEVSAGGGSIKVRNLDLFAVEDVVTLLKGTGTGATAISRFKGIASGMLKFDPPLTGAQAGDVLAVVRFEARSKITSDAPLTLSDSSNFRVGDLVAVMDNPTLVCAEVSEILPGNVLVLKSGLPVLVNQTLGVVFVNSVAGVTALTPSSITIDSVVAARAGWYAARLNRWMDVTDPVTLSAALPDGTLPGDSIGLAALTSLQPTIRFGLGAGVAALAQLNLSGLDAVTRVPRQVDTVVQQVSGNRQATLSPLPKGLVLRPEEISAIPDTTITLADDFAAYAQSRGLSLCWLGCQIPAPQPKECPGIPDNGTCSCQ